MRPLPRAFALMGRERDGRRKAPRSETATGMLMVLGAIFAFTLMDATAKHLRGDYEVAQIVWARFAGNLALVALVFRGRFFALLRSRQPAIQIGRSLMQLSSVSLFFTSLGFIGLAEATAIMDLNPVLITLGAALFLGEKVGWRRVAGIVAAMIGAMIIIRPGAGVLHPAAILPLIGAVTFAAGAILTRVARNDPTSTSVIYSALVGSVLTSLVVPFHWTPIAMADLPAFLALGLLGGIAQAMLIRGFVLAEAAVVAPFTYTGLIWATAWGWLFFGELPDFWTIIGGTIIVCAGLYIWAREAQQARAAGSPSEDEARP